MKETPECDKYNKIFVAYESHFLCPYVKTHIYGIKNDYITMDEKQKTNELLKAYQDNDMALVEYLDKTVDIDKCLTDACIHIAKNDFNMQYCDHVDTTYRITLPNITFGGYSVRTFNNKQDGIEWIGSEKKYM